MCKATEGTKWEAISGCATGMNAWLFVDENIAPAIKVGRRRFMVEPRLTPGFHT